MVVFDSDVAEAGCAGFRAAGCDRLRRNQRGGAIEISVVNNIIGRATGFEVIEDLLPAHNIDVSLRLPGITKSRLIPEGIDFSLHTRQRIRGCNGGNMPCIADMIST